jgi:hypothetical protein
MLTIHLRRLAKSQLVIAGLDPAIHGAAEPVDARIKSGHDGNVNEALVSGF